MERADIEPRPLQEPEDRSQLSVALQEQHSRVGQDVGVSGWVAVTQRMIDDFATVTDDHQFIHTDPAKSSSQSPFGTTVAHGFLTLSLASRFAREALDPIPGQVAGLNYGFNKIRFLGPVKSGSSVRGKFRLISVREHTTGGLLRELRLEVEVRGQRHPAMVANWLILGLFEVGI